MRGVIVAATDGCELMALIEPRVPERQPCTLTFCHATVDDLDCVDAIPRGRRRIPAAAGAPIARLTPRMVDRQQRMRPGDVRRDISHRSAVETEPEIDDAARAVYVRVASKRCELLASKEQQRGQPFL